MLELSADEVRGVWGQYIQTLGDTLGAIKVIAVNARRHPALPPEVAAALDQIITHADISATEEEMKGKDFPP